MVTKEITKELVEKQMNSTLSGFPWGGKVIAVCQNEWGEWIADCKIPGHYSRDCDGPGGHYYRMEDADCPVRQFMVVLEYQESRFGMEPWWLTRYWEASKNMRQPTFPESMDFFDPDAPRSPYILTKLKASIEKHPVLFELQEMWDKFSNIPINNDDEIEEPFYFWEAGTSRFEIWHWFDKLCPNGLAVDLMGETPKNKETMKSMSDTAWLYIYGKFYNERYEHHRKSGVSTAEAIDQAFQETVGLEFHPYSPVQRPINQRMLTEWGEEHHKMLDAELYIAIINADAIYPEVGIIKVKYGWLHRELPQWLIDNGHYDYFYEIPDDNKELIEHFLFVYCDYSQNNLHWQCVPADTKFKRLTVKDFQKMKTLQEIIASHDYRHAVVALENGQEIEGMFIDVRCDRNSLATTQKAYDIRSSDDNDSEPATIENKVAVNWFGTLITGTPISFPENDAFLQIVDFGFTD